MKKRKKLIFILPILMFSLTACDVSHITEDINKDAFLSKLIPNWPTFVAQICALILLIVLFIIFGYKPVKKIINKRKDYIEQNIHESEENKAEAIKNNKLSEERILASKKEANDIISNAKVEALNERNKIMEETTHLVEEMKVNASNDIELAKQEAKESIQKEMVEVALLASEQVLSREVNKEDNSKLAEDFIKEMNK